MNQQQAKGYRGFLILMLAAATAVCSPGAMALDFSFPGLGDETVEGVLNTTITAGGAWRMHDPSVDLIGKADLNPDACGRGANGRPLYQSCQGLFRDQSFPAARLAEVPGQYTMNADDGNLNYGKGDMISGLAKVTQDLSLKMGDFGFFGKILFFYDAINNDFTENHPNQINRDNYLQVGSPSVLGLTDTIPRLDSRPCPTDRNPSGGLLPCGIVYGKGGQVYSQRTDGETLREIGTDLQFLDAYFYGKLPLPFEKQLTFKIGRQAVNWGESTLLAFGSINQANPINANNFYRVGGQVEEFFIPVNMAFLSTEPFEGATLEAFYQLEWKPLETPAPGSYLSFLDLGTNNAGNDWVNLSFGGSADDRDRDPAFPNGGYGRLQDNSLSGLTNTSLRAQRLPDKEPGSSGQFGLALKYYAEWLNNGTELGFYFENYHSRIPMLSVYSTDLSCGAYSRSTVEFFADCPNMPVFHQLTNMNDPAGATDSAVPFDSLQIQLEYPRNIQLYGVSFNTTAGDLSFQGEIAYRPREPLQVSVVDVVFTGFAPTLGKCHLRSSGCVGTTGGLGLVPGGGNTLYGSSDYLNADGTAGDYTDTFDLLIGAGVGSGRSFPSFLEAYRYGTVGETPANTYVRGYEYFQTFQFNLGGTYVLGATDNFVGADQVLLLFETGATYVPGLPAYDQLQLEAPGMYTHASAGADGSGFTLADPTQPVSASNPYIATGGQRMACSTIEDCSYGPDGLRFNPHQQDPSFFPDKLSAGYDVIALIRYESILPGISLQPQIIWKHDVYGTAPGLATNFVEGRKTADVLLETRYKSSMSFNLGYTWFFGGGSANLNRDRDFARVFAKFQF